MARYKAYAITTKYWRPGEDYIKQIIKSVEGKVSDGDFVVVSEKAIATAMGNIVDESKVKPSLNAKIIARIWMPLVWGYLLGPVCHLRRKLIQQLRSYPTGCWKPPQASRPTTCWLTASPNVRL
jgi:F420-0:gamma-glutamyl ligase-like protein